MVLSVTKKTNLKQITELINVTRDVKVLGSQFSAKKS